MAQEFDGKKGFNPGDLAKAPAKAQEKFAKTCAEVRKGKLPAEPSDANDTSEIEPPNTEEPEPVVEPVAETEPEPTEPAAQPAPAASSSSPSGRRGQRRNPDYNPQSYQQRR